VRSEIWNCLLNVVSLHAEKENIMESEFKFGFKVLLTAVASDHYNTSYAYDLMATSYPCSVTGCRTMERMEQWMT